MKVEDDPVNHSQNQPIRNRAAQTRRKSTVSNTISNKVSGKMSSRSWAIALGVGAALLAAVLLVVYVNRYQSRATGANAPTPVLQATKLIVKGTPGTLVAAQTMYKPITVPRKEVEVGAIADPAYLVGRAAAVDVFPGAQLTAESFSADASLFVESQITGDQRAISVSVDNVHGSLSQLQPGDHIDIYIGLGAQTGGQAVVKLFRSNVEVLAVPAADETGNLILKVKAADAADFAYAADNTTLWFVIRPAAGAKPTPKDSANIATVLR
jgi:Flp pilus assembly protein CpaB